MTSQFRSSLTSATGSSMSRRSFLRSFAVAGIGAAALAAGGGNLAQRAMARSTDSMIVNSSGTRLRAGAGLSFAILDTLPEGTEVQYLGDGGSADGYQWYRVMDTRNGTPGYIASFLLSPPGVDYGDPQIVTTGITTDWVNLRSGPSTGHQVLRVVSVGSVVDLSDRSENGFRYVVHDGLAGWMYEAYISVDGAQPGETTFTTTDYLNLRAEPSLSAKVLLVMPVGATVNALPGAAAGWRQVQYKGTVGWASTDYLN
jgi:uncharacterized protein YgiM (DUF1202 family)